MVGYATKPLADKLGLKPGAQACVMAPPDGFLEGLGDRGAHLEVADTAQGLAPGAYDYLHLFTREQQQLALSLPHLRAALKDPGMLWVSWPKRASRVPTDVTETVVRAMALDRELVDIKVCAIDDVWSGLKLVIPVALRGGSS